MRQTKYIYHLVVLIFICVILSACRDNGSKVKLPRMMPTYSYKDKLPMGLNVAYRLMNTQFGQAPVKVNAFSFEKTLPLLNLYNSGTIYVIIAEELKLGEAEVSYMLNYVSRGNTLFVSAESIDTVLLRLLKIDIVNNEELNILTDSSNALFMRDQLVSIEDPYTGEYNKYGFFYEDLSSGFERLDTSASGVFGIGANGLPNYLGIKYGSGYIWVHSNPSLFSNYFLLTKNNHQYFEKVFSYLTNRPVIVFWDDYYHKSHFKQSFFSLRVFFKYPALTMALLTGICLLLLYAAFSGKRKQKIIPILKPNINSSVSFVKTVGLLYLQQNDNKNIALKMVTHFWEYIRSHYFITSHTMDEEFIKALSRKSGVNEVRVRQLVSIVEEMPDKEQISNMELLELHNRIQEFYKK
ncbi:MAG TPA: DUF4350 domain-containing protein [Chitinophagaceae bacterium]|nr:DUF4350 domain-containing protein [Chitinophagaceae bacterium]